MVILGVSFATVLNGCKTPNNSPVRLSNCMRPFVEPCVFDRWELELKLLQLLLVNWWKMMLGGLWTLDPKGHRCKEDFEKTELVKQRVKAVKFRI